MTRFSKEKEENFIERLSRQLNEMKVPSKEKKIILELFETELKHPTTKEDAIERYNDIIRANQIK